MCDVGYLCGNFSVPRSLCSGVRPDVRDRQTYLRQTDRCQTRRRPLMPLPYGGGGIIISTAAYCRNFRGPSISQWSTASFVLISFLFVICSSVACGLAAFGRM